jgi:hypothetical protein
MTENTMTDFPHLRRASPVQLALIDRLRRGERLELSAEHDFAEANRLWGVEVQEVRRWAARVRIGTVHGMCAEIRTWAPITRQRFGVEDAHQLAVRGGRR